MLLVRGFKCSSLLFCRRSQPGRRTRSLASELPRRAQYGLNSSGQIVGLGNTATPSTVALLETANGVLQDLNTLIPAKSTRTLVSANAINDAGQIVADATAKSGKGSYAVLLTPIMNTSLGSSANPSQAGQTVTFIATVQSIAGPPAIR